MTEAEQLLMIKRQSDMQWEPPEPLEEYERPPFPIESLPVILREVSRAVSEQFQTPVDASALLSLAAVSTACAGKIDVQAHKGWVEQMVVFVLLCMGVGERKSALVSYFISPILSWQTQQFDDMKAAVEQSLSQKRILQNQLSKAENKGDTEAASTITAELAAFEEVHPPRLLADDVTPEALARIMAQNHGCAAVWSAEGGFFSMLNGRYAKDGSANIDLVLKAHPGDTVFIDRVGRPSEAIKNPALTLMLAVQQDVLEELMGNKTFRQRGLCGRFLYSIPASLVGKRKVQSDPIPDVLTVEYRRIIACLLDIPYPKNRHLLQLSPEAAQVFQAWGEEIEPRLVEEWQPIGGWANKLHGLTLRIAGLLHMASCRSWETPIAAHTMQQAITIGRYAATHALAAFGSVGTDGAVFQAKKVIEAIRKGNHIAFNKRDLMRAIRTIKSAKELDPVLLLLEEKGYISSDPLTQPFDGMGRPQGMRWIVSPYVHKRMVE